MVINELSEPPYPLSERERELVGWALRKQAASPSFHNQGMKREVLELAQSIAPEHTLELEAMNYNAPEGP